MGQAHAVFWGGLAVYPHEFGLACPMVDFSYKR